MIEPGLKAKAIKPWVGVNLPKESIAGPTRLTAAQGPEIFAAFNEAVDALLKSVLDISK